MELTIYEIIGGVGCLFYIILVVTLTMYFCLQNGKSRNSKKEDTEDKSKEYYQVYHDDEYPSNKKSIVKHQDYSTPDSDYYAPLNVNNALGTKVPKKEDSDNNSDYYEDYDEKAASQNDYYYEQYDDKGDGRVKVPFQNNPDYYELYDETKDVY